MAFYHEKFYKCTYLLFHFLHKDSFTRQYYMLKVFKFKPLKHNLTFNITITSKETMLYFIITKS